MKVKILIFSIISTLIGCNNSQFTSDAEFGNNLKEIRIDPKNSVNISISEIVDSLKYIPLETNPENYIKSIDKLIYYENNLYILDKSTKAIYCYSINGEYLYKIRQVGKGPGEYLKIEDIIINPFKARLEILDRISRKLVCYNLLSKEWVEDIRLDHLVYNFIVTNPNSYFIYTMGSGYFNNENNLKYNLLSISSRGNKVLGKYCVAFEGSIHHGFPSMLSRSNDTTALFSCFYNDTIFEIKQNLLYPKYFINFGRYSLPSGIAELNIDKRMSYDKDPYAYHLNSFYETNNILYFQYIYKNQLKKVIYYKNKDKLMNFNYMISNDIDGIPLGKIEYINQDKMLFSISATRLSRFIINDPRVDSTIKNNLRNIKTNNNPIIAIGKLK